MERVQKYAKPARIFHWVHTAAFLILIITGIFLFVPAIGFLAQDSWSRLVHRIAAVVFIFAPLIEILASKESSKEHIKKAFTWGAEDIEWLKAAPRYYFLGDESAMPPQDEMNTGQKLWFFIVLIFSPIFVITGIFLWFLKGIVPQEVFQWSLFIHDVAFIVTFLMFLIHVYLGVLHPLMRQHGGAFGSMVDGTVSAEYAKSHHGKWYRKVTGKNS